MISRRLEQLLLWPARARGRRRLRRIVLENIQNRSFVVMPEVFNPATFRSGRVLAEYIANSPGLNAKHQNSTALDLGTGCGVQAIMAAARGFSVTAIDINPHAVRCARLNVLLNHAEESVTVLEGDLFSPIEHQTFDLVVFNPPFFDGNPTSTFELAWRSTDGIERFAASLPAALNADATALIIWSSHADETRLLNALSRSGLKVSKAHTCRVVGEKMTIFQAQR